MKKILPKDAILVPDSAGKVFSGVLFDVYQWQQEMFDGSKKTFEMLKRSDTVLILAVNDGKVILVDDEQPDRHSIIGFPGGRVDSEDESWLKAAKRELLEETGFTFKNWKLISVLQPQHKVESFVPLFLATDLISEVKQSLDSDGEKITVLQKPYDEFREMLLNTNNHSMVYEIPLILQCKTIEDLLALPEYTGKVIDR